MKKIYIALAVIPAMMLVSCQQEQSFNDLQVGEFDVAFTISNGATRSGESAPLVRQGAIIPMESQEAGQSLFLEETIVDLNQIGAEPITRGTPAYTENLGVLYANELLVQGNKGLFTTETGYWNKEKEMVKGGWRYQGSYNGNPWPADENESVDLYFRMPSTQTNVTSITRNGGKFTFNYTSPATAKAQQDILFAYRPLTKAQHKAYLKQGGTPILFNHALSGVKFAISNESEELANVGIKSVTITGLKNQGTCTLTPAQEDDYRDNKTGNYSSANAARWTLGTTTGTFSSEDFGDPVEYENGGSFEHNGKYGDNFAPSTINNEKANTQNLNDTDGTQTFWFIPQEITDKVELTIVFTEDGGNTYIPWKVKFGAALKKKNGQPVKWEAGELRTYTIKIDLVNLTVDDEIYVKKGTEKLIDETDQGEVEFDAISYIGSYKDAVTITNTGNTDAFIRATIIGQWYDAATHAPVFGFTDYTTTKVKTVDSWYKDQFINTNAGQQGTFTDLAGYKGAANEINNWVYNPNDGYYYYKYVVPVGESIPDTDPLFTRYTVGSVPTVRVAGEAREIYFVLEIATQAVSANKLDKSHYATYTEAWNIEERIQ